MANDELTTTVKLMTADEAKKSRDLINEHVGKGSAHVIAANRETAIFIHKEGWRALGYSSWDSCRSKEFQFSRSRVYQLLDEAAVQEELKKTLDSLPDLSSRALMALKDAPAGKRAEVLKDAQKEHKTKTPTGTQIAKTAKKKKFAKKETSISDRAENDKELSKSLDRIGQHCGRKFREAIEDEVIEIGRSEIILLAEQKPDRMKEAEKLISTNRWTVQRSLKFLTKQPQLKDPIETLTFLSQASDNAKWEGTFGAFTISVKWNKRK